jgi:insertion element IS1 protein InsB
VDRESRCIVGWAVVPTRTPEILQAMLDRSPQAAQYYSDGYTLYDALIYTPGHHLALVDKSQTYSVEADNAELRHYLARLARRSRCFSRCIRALPTAVKLFVFAWNRRQMHKRRFPSYTAHLRDFVCP